MGIFSTEEMARRQQALGRALEEKGLEIAFLHTADNVFYTTRVPLLSGWGRPMWGVVKHTGEAAVVGAMIEKENMERHAQVREVLAYADETNVYQASLKLVSDVLQRWAPRATRIGLERDLLPVGLHEVLQERFPEAGFVDIGDDLGAIRIIKSEEEIALLELGATIAKLGANAFLEALSENTTELAVVAHAVAEMNRALGALCPDALTSTYAYCQTGEHTMTPHLHATGKRIHRGELVALNVFPVIWGYCTELERTFVFGEPTDEHQKALDAVNEAFEAGKEALRPGVRAREVDELTRDILARHHYQEFIRHGTGHAHGIMIGQSGREELGELRIYNDTLLKPNMANSVEPGIYVPGLGGFRHSDVMIVTDSAARCITDFPRDIVFGGG